MGWSALRSYSRRSRGDLGAPRSGGTQDTLRDAKTLRDRSAQELARAEANLRAARLLFYETLSTTWERTRAGEPNSLEQKADLLLANVHAADAGAAVTMQMHALAGTSGIYTRNPLERHLRDAQTLRHHGFFAATRYETVGQVRLGLPPEFGLVAF